VIFVIGNADDHALHVIPPKSPHAASCRHAVNTGVRLSADGKWLYASEQPYADRPGAPLDARATLGPHRWDGASLRVLDADSGRQVAELARDQLVQQLVLYGSDHVYIDTPTDAYHGTQPYQAGEQLMQLIGYEVGSWREVARRSGHLNLRLAVPS
jgi:hypothetical protein